MLSVATVIFLLNLITSVMGHGFLFYPTPRGINEEVSAISDLRNPNHAGLCRGLTKRSNDVTPVSLKDGQPFTVKLAMSNGAEHIGPCQVFIGDSSDMSNAVQIGDSGPAGCSHLDFQTNKGAPASQQCPGKVPPPPFHTNDMCLHQWTFKVANMSKVSCKNCVMRWFWTAKHISPPELYENCADITLNGKGATNESTSPSDAQPTPSAGSDASTGDAQPTPSAGSDASTGDAQPSPSAGSDASTGDAQPSPSAGSDPSTGDAQPSSSDGSESATPSPAASVSNVSSNASQNSIANQSDNESTSTSATASNGSTSSGCTTDLGCVDSKTFVRCIAGKQLAAIKCPDGTVCKEGSSGSPCVFAASSKRRLRF